VGSPSVELDARGEPTPVFYLHQGLDATRRARVLISGTPLTLIFPTKPAVVGGTRLIPLEEPRFRGRPIPAPKIAPRSGWGNYDANFDRLFVRAVRFVGPIHPVVAIPPPTTPMGFTTEPLYWLREAWPPWYELVQDWLCAWTGLHRNQRIRVEHSERLVDAAVERRGSRTMAPSHLAWNSPAMVPCQPLPRSIYALRSSAPRKAGDFRHGLIWFCRRDQHTLEAGTDGA
jgi:hypothetical protein